METITYLVANHNNARYLEDCLRSLKDQTCDRWQCLVCDDASTDDSVAVIKRHANYKIRLLQNSANVGYIRTLKRMVAAAPGDIVGILDSDDALTEDATACVLQAYADNDTGFVYSRFAVMDESLRRQAFISGAPGVDNGLDNGKHWELLLTIGNVSAIRTFRKSLYYRTSGLDESMLYAEDRDLIFKLEEATRPVFIDKVLYKYRFLRNSQCHNPANAKIAVRNHYRAKKNALHRRKVRGAKYFLLVAYLKLSRYSPRPPPQLLSARERWPKRLCRGVIRITQNGLLRIITPISPDYGRSNHKHGTAG